MEAADAQADSGTVPLTSSSKEIWKSVLSLTGFSGSGMLGSVSHLLTDCRVHTMRPPERPKTALFDYAAASAADQVSLEDTSFGIRVTKFAEKIQKADLEIPQLKVAKTKYIKSFPHCGHL